MNFAGEPSRPMSDGDHSSYRPRHLRPHLLDGRKPGVSHQGDDVISDITPFSLLVLLVFTFNGFVFNILTHFVNVPVCPKGEIL